jgi:colanic acid biosynthesis glycosyl transferase WcaI
LVLWLERTVLRRFDVVSTVSKRMTERLEKKGVPLTRIRFFPNWVDTGCVKPLAGASSYREELGIDPGAVVVLFSGTLAGKQGLMVIPQVAAMMADRPDVVFVVCGDGVMKEALENSARELPNFRMIPLQPSERLGDLLGMADIHLLPQSPSAADLVLPSKLSGMLASGRPVVATCNAGTELDSVVAECGAVVPPEDGQALTEIILKLANDPQMRRELGRKARSYAECNFERDVVLRKFFGSFLDKQAQPTSGDIDVAA